MRTGSIQRSTKETSIEIDFNIDGEGISNISTGNGFMDHMLILFTKHGLFDLTLQCKGDTYIDFHHSAEDIGICLGMAVAKALGDSLGIFRYGTMYLPMDESLARVSLDIAGRPNLVYNVVLTDRKINDFDCDLVEDFLKAFTDNAKITMHVDLLRGRNSHHSIEAVFKAVGKALSQACMINERAKGQVPSTKGVL